MPEISVKDQIEKLVELQKIDTEIYSIKEDLKEKPRYIENLKEQFESTKARLQELEDQTKQIQVKRKDKELELQQKEEATIKANGELNQIKTNKEYTAKLKEMESIKADQSVIEEQILQSYEEADKINVLIEEEKKSVAEKEQTFQSEKKKIEDEMKEMETRVKTLEDQRNTIVPGVDRIIIDRYEKVLANKQGLAIAPIHGSTCGGCHMNITPQMINVLKIHQEIVSCEMCQRILYIEADTE